jgi:hypothetical protein
MAFECLLVSNDPGIFSLVNRVLKSLSIQTIICLTSSRALKALDQSSPDLIVIDWEGESSAELLRRIWRLRFRMKPTIVAICTMECHTPGVHIVINRPVTSESSAKGFKAAYSKMLMDHRRHARYALMIPAEAANSGGQLLSITVADIGDGGLGLITKENLVVGDLLSFHLLLPGSPRVIFIQLRVLWTRDFGRAGCEFLRIPPVDLTILSDWLRAKVGVKKPLIPV